MRVKRLEKFKKTRYRKGRKFIFLALVLPSSLVFVGYIISSFFIIPVIASK